MDWTDWVGAVASTLAITAVVLSVMAYTARAWILKEVHKFRGEISPQLSNDGTSVAVYAHNAAEAAIEAKDAAIEAKEAACEAKEAAIAAKDVAVDIKRILVND